VLMLVHSQEPSADGGRERPYWEPNWAVWTRVAIALVLGFAALSADGGVATLLIIAAFYAGCRAVAEAVPYTGGLTEWRQ